MPSLAAAIRPNIKPAAGNFPVGNDAASRRLAALPLSARTKFDKLRRAELRSRALIDGLREQIDHARSLRASAAADLAAFDHEHPERFTTAIDDIGVRKQIKVEPLPERARLAAILEGRNADLEALMAERAAAGVGHNTAAILSWLLEQGDAKFVAAPTIKIAKDVNLSAELDRNRRAQAALCDKLVIIGNSPLTVAEAKAAGRAEVAALAERGRPNVANLLLGHPVEWATELFTAHGAKGEIVSTTIKDTFAFMVWANKDTVIGLLDKEIEALGDDNAALTRQERATQTAQAEAALLELQRQEEGLIERAESDGLTIARTCTNPLVLLGIERAA